MAENIPPRTDELLPAWAQNVGEKASAQGPLYGISPTMTTDLISKTGLYTTALDVARDPTTKGPLSTKRKNLARAELLRLATTVVALVRGQPGLTEAQLYEIGIPLRRTPQPIGRPTIAPVLRVISVNGRTVVIGISSGLPDHRGLAPNSIGVGFFSHVGPNPPADMGAWKFEAMTGRSTVELQFPLSVPDFSPVFFTAMYFSARKETGPACVPVQAYLGHASVAAAA